MAAANKLFDNRVVLKPVTDQDQGSPNGIFIPGTVKESQACFGSGPITETPAKEPALSCTGIGEYD